jgi:hypothetical protein
MIVEKAAGTGGKENLASHNENLGDAIAVTVIAFWRRRCGTVPTMAKPSKILGITLALMLCATVAVAADAPAKKPWKDGWDQKQIKVFAYACTDGLLQPAVRDYNAAAQSDGVKLHKPFPEKQFRDSAFPMCLCISEWVAETWTVAEVEKKGTRRSGAMIDEALNGGRCAPDGLLGDILKKRKANPK